tara:strand:- start:767 stop:937 length:171 start_codon:yes stop_codon:yes gene_type:complete
MYIAFFFACLSRRQNLTNKVATKRTTPSVDATGVLILFVNNSPQIQTIKTITYNID